MKLLEKYENLIVKYLVAAILLVVPLYPKFPFISVPGTFVSIRVEDFLILISGLFLLRIVLKDFRKLIKQPIIKAIVLFLLIGLLSLFYSVLVTKTSALHLGILHWARRVEYFIPFFLGIYSLKRKENLSFYIKVLMLTTFLIFVYALGQRYFSWPIIATQNQEYSQGVALRYVPGGHINSTFAGHYDLSTFLILVLPIFINLLLLLFEKAGSKISKLIISAIILFGMWLIAVSGSRISSFSFLVSSTLALIIIKKYKAIPVFIAVSLMVFSISPSLRVRYLRLFEVTKNFLTQVHTNHNTSIVGNVYAFEEVLGVPERRDIPTPTPTPIPKFEDRSTSIRLNVEWPRAIRAFLKNPLLGTGYSSISLATDNDYLRMIGEVGLFGLVAFSLIFVNLFEVIVKLLRKGGKYNKWERAFTAGIIGSLPGIFINAIFIDVFEASKFATIFWLLVGIFYAFARDKKYE